MPPPAEATITFDADSTRILTRLANRPYYDHLATEAWNRVVVANRDDGEFLSKAVLGRGLADFDAPFNGLGPTDRVCVYCHFMFKNHVAAGSYAWGRAESGLGLQPGAPVLVVDVGCGPMTFEVARALRHREAGLGPMTACYVGVDQSRAMLEKARSFSVDSELFAPGSVFEWATGTHPADSVLQSIDRVLSATGIDTIAFVFSYLFASPWVEARQMAWMVNLAVSRNRPRTKQVCVVYCNPSRYERGLHLKWNEFLAGLNYFQKADVQSIDLRLMSLKNPGKLIRLHSETLVARHPYSETFDLEPDPLTARG